MTSRSNPPLSHRSNVERQIIRRREREFDHEMRWGGRVKYYSNVDKSNRKFESWTSPRYYESNTKLWEEVKSSRDKKEILEKRREKLKKLFMEDEATYNAELIMVKSREGSLAPLSSRRDDIPMEILKDVNLGLKIAEDDKRRHEAEIKLYHSWRNNNPMVRNYERSLGARDLKLSWLDQQIQKRMEQEKSEEECRKMLRERDKRIEEQKKEEEKFQLEIKEKNEHLRQELLDQIKQLEIKQQQSEELQRIEDQELKTRLKLQELEEQRLLEEKLCKEREIALYNVRQHKLRLKMKSKEMMERLESEKKLVKDLLDAEIVEKIADEKKKKDVRDTLKQFLEFAREQEALEKDRRKYLDFVFDSEAEIMFKKQNEIWEMEKEAREKLLKNVMTVLRAQIEEKIEENKRKQAEVLKEREEALKIMEKCNEEMERLKLVEEEKKIEFRKELDEQIRDRNRRKLELQTLEQRDIEKKIEMARKEEERLKNEIMRLQMRQGPKSRRNKLF